MQAMIEHASYMAHGYCLLWQPWLVTLWAGSDLLIFISYMAIPLALLSVLRKRPDLKHRGLIALFAGFILLCGLTHALSIVTLWYPIYPFVGAVKLATGLVSAATAISLFRLVPALVAIPSPQKLNEVIGQLQAEATEHRETLEQLELAREKLELRVEERTAELTLANERMSVMVGEALHRARNLLGVVISLARQTVRSAPDMDAFVEAFMGRLEALATATSAMNSGAETSSVELETIVRKQLAPVLETYPQRISISGPPLTIGLTAAQQLALAVHELATNAVKYGSLKHDTGTVGISWQLNEDTELRLTFAWSERGGGAPKRGGVVQQEQGEESAGSGGFGSRLLLQAVPSVLGGEADRDLAQEGLDYVLKVPLARIAPSIARRRASSVPKPA